MESFVFQNPTKIIFGAQAVAQLADALAPVGKRILLAYGGGSIKRNGIYDAVRRALADAGKEVWELPDIRSNPRTEKVAEGIALCRAHQIDFILAVGGGSTIDCAKAIAAASRLPEDADWWDILFLRRTPVTETIPLGTVLTMAATGSEMNGNAVVTHWEKKQKLGMWSPAVYPVFSILDPTYTYTLPREQVAYGIADMLSHLLESYMSAPDASNVTDDLIEQLLRTIMEQGRIAMQDLTNASARANLMWAATLALNGLTTLGKKGDWMAHNIEHALSAFYDIPHGAGLAIVHPMLLRFEVPHHVDRFVRFAERVMGLSVSDYPSREACAYAGVDAFRAYLASIGCPTTMREVGISEERLPEIASSVRVFRTSYHDFTTEDVLTIYRSAYE